MLATRVRQKDSAFYFVSYPAEDLLRRVKFISRYYGEGDQIAPDAAAKEDEVGRFIARIERSEKAFQRRLSKRKVASILNFYEEALHQPPIPGTVLLFTAEALGFDPLGRLGDVGDLQEPRGGYLIIDGQHRLAALEFYQRKHPDDARTIHVPCIVFDGRTEDFATEMFVVINSTPTRINRSHLIDLYERVSFATPDKKVAAKVCELLYERTDSPLRYKVNRLGGRSKQRKWILQAELFFEVHRWVRADEEALGNGELKGKRLGRIAERSLYEPLRDGLKAARKVFGDAWDNERYMVTRAVTLKALIRLIADLWRAEGDAAEGREQRWTERLEPLGALKQDLRAEGFYERFPAKGQVERVGRIHRVLAEAVGLKPGPARRAAGA